MVELLEWRKEGERRPCVLTCVSLCLKTHGEESHDISVLKKLPCTERCSFGLIGDPKQLAPTVMSWVVARYGYGVSMFVTVNSCERARGLIECNAYEAILSGH